MFSDREYHCGTCRANWTQGEWTDGCAQCGGGAMSVPCLQCSGECGRQWHRQLMESWDFGIAHWMGGCGLISEQSSS